MTSDTSPQDGARARLTLLFSIVAASALADRLRRRRRSPAPAPAPAPAPQALTCDDTMKTAFTPDANTTVLARQVVQGRRSDRLVGNDGTPPVAAKDLCFVKLNVGPGNPGPASAPSTSPGIGIEVWLPAPANWNEKIHNIGGGGWAGGARLSEHDADRDHRQRRDRRQRERRRRRDRHRPQRRQRFVRDEPRRRRSTRRSGRTSPSGRCTSSRSRRRRSLRRIT